MASLTRVGHMVAQLRNQPDSDELYPAFVSPAPIDYPHLELVLVEIYRELKITFDVVESRLFELAALEAEVDDYLLFVDRLN